MNKMSYHIVYIVDYPTHTPENSKVKQFLKTIAPKPINLHSSVKSTKKSTESSNCKQKRTN